MKENRQPVTVDELALSTTIEEEARVRLLVDKALRARDNDFGSCETRHLLTKKAVPTQNFPDREIRRTLL